MQGVLRKYKKNVRKPSGAELYTEISGLSCLPWQKTILVTILEKKYMEIIW